MKISSLVDILGARLLNKPKISAVYSIESKVSKVKEGSIFFAKDKSKISQAIKRGAFGIVLEELKDIEIQDKEIAWIEVSSLEESFIKLLRYKLSHLELEAFFCPSPIIELLKLGIKNKENIFISKSIPIEEHFEKLNKADKITRIFSDDKNLLSKIYPQTKDFILGDFSINNLIEHSLFKTSFSCNNDFFSKLNLASLYLGHFLSVYYFLEKDFDCSKLKKFPFLKARFIDKDFNSLEYGQGGRFFLNQESVQLSQNELSYIKIKYSYAKLDVISKKELRNFAFPYIQENDFKKLKIYLKAKDFSCLYFIGFSLEELEEDFINKEEDKSSLF